MKSTTYGSYKVYNLDRSVGDCIRFRSDIEPEIYDIIIEKYKANPKRDLARLSAYAQAMRFGKKAEEVL